MEAGFVLQQSPTMLRYSTEQLLGRIQRYSERARLVERRVQGHCHSATAFNGQLDLLRRSTLHRC